MGGYVKGDSPYLWILACEVLKWHNKGSDRCIDTLNRLWNKHTEVRGKNGERLLEVPVLKEEMLSVTAEHWSLSRLAALKRSHARSRPLFFPPIIVLRWVDREFLIDGTTRVNLWSEQGNVGPHAVLKIAVRAE
jgi:hypothetical protein